jgi:hypothetical protein
MNWRNGMTLLWGQTVSAVTVTIVPGLRGNRLRISTIKGMQTHGSW